MNRHRQLHLWITDHDYSMLRDIAEQKKETLSSVVRRLIKIHHPGRVLSETDGQLPADSLYQSPM